MRGNPATAVASRAAHAPTGALTCQDDRPGVISVSRPVEIDPERLERWFDAFAARHGVDGVSLGATEVVVVGRDGTQARCRVPSPPLDPAPLPASELPWAPLVAHATRARRLGLLLVRRGGVAVGVAEAGALRAHRVVTRRVQGRTAAGGWSQQRFARRRAQQTDGLLEAAVRAAVAVVLPALSSPGGLAGVVTGGDRLLLARVLADRRLAPLVPLVAQRRLDVADPRLAVLAEAARRARCVEVTVVAPPGVSQPTDHGRPG